MNKHFKLLTISFIIALTLATPQAIYATEDFSKPGEEGLKRQNNALSVSSDADITNQSSKRIRIDGVNNESRPFVSRTYLALGLELQRLVVEAIYLNTPKLYAYQKFLDGKLIYRPIPESDEGMIEMKISDLANPLAGTFDLSKCGEEACKYLSISTGYRKEIEPENADKMEIWIAPWCLIKKRLSTTAGHFQDIMDNWNEETAPVGIFFTWGGWEHLDWYDYFTSEDLEFISNNNLHEAFLLGRRQRTPHPHPPSTIFPLPRAHILNICKRFRVHF